MRYRHAIKLHNSDEVLHKKTRRICRVITTLRRGNKTVLISMVHPKLGYLADVHHHEVK